jgi:hypothetical protein
MRRNLSTVLLLVAVSAALVVACGDDDSDAEPHEAAVDVGAMLASLDILGSAGLHHMEMTLTVEGGGIEPAWLGSLRNARTAVAVIDWPEPLHELAEAFLAQSMPFEMALADDDAGQAAETVTPAHGAFHALSGAGFAFLAEQAGMSAAEHDGDSDHD